MERRLKIFMVLAVVVLLVVLAMLLRPEPSNMQLQKEKIAAISIRYGNGTTSKTNVYLAESQLQQETGLMYVKSMGNCNGIGNCYGMLFIFPNSSEQCFWMDNTFMPLKQIWITGNVVTSVYNATPYSTNTICHTGNQVLEAYSNSSISTGDIVLESNLT